MFNNIMTFLLFRVNRDRFSDLSIRPFRVTLGHMRLLCFLGRFRVFTCLYVRVFFIYSLLYRVQVMNSILRSNSHVVHDLLFS